MNRKRRSPESRLPSQLKRIWRLAMPFWIFRDAGRGSIEQQAANYRYNRSQRKVLPFYIWKWIGIAVCLMQMLRVLSGLTAATSANGTGHACATFLCVGTGIAFAFACTVIAVLCASYLFLTHVRR